MHDIKHWEVYCRLLWRWKFIEFRLSCFFFCSFIHFRFDLLRCLWLTLNFFIIIWIFILFFWLWLFDRLWNRCILRLTFAAANPFNLIVKLCHFLNVAFFINVCLFLEVLFFLIGQVLPLISNLLHHVQRAHIRIIPNDSGAGLYSKLW